MRSYSFERGLRTSYVASEEVQMLTWLAFNRDLCGYPNFAPLPQNLFALCPATVVPLDQCMVLVAQEVARVARNPGITTSGQRIIISNTQGSAARGQHWFTVIFEVKRRRADHAQDQGS